VLALIVIFPAAGSWGTLGAAMSAIGKDPRTAGADVRPLIAVVPLPENDAEPIAGPR
jgi:hypothetical protein